MVFLNERTAQIRSQSRPIVSLLFSNSNIKIADRDVSLLVVSAKTSPFSSITTVGRFLPLPSYNATRTSTLATGCCCSSITLTLTVTGMAHAKQGNNKEIFVTVLINIIMTLHSLVRRQYCFIYHDIHSG